MNMKTNITPGEIEFSQAANNWNLEKLYIDLATTKGKSLTPVEKKILRGLLCGYSPLEISNQIYHNSSSSSGVRVYLSNGLYKYIENLLTNQTGENVKIKNWSRVTNLLEKAGYKKLGISFVDSSPKPTSMQSIVLDSPQVSNYNYQKKLHNHHLFYGRTNEVDLLQKWILDQNYRLIEVLGMVGIGKTALVLNILPDIQQYFQFVLWRSLDNISTFTELITTLLQDINPDQIPEQISRKTNLLLKHLQQYRCLIILDKFDYLVEDREQYINFFQRIGRTNNHSCMMITSRKKTQEIAWLSGDNLPVNTLAIKGLNTTSAQEIFRLKGLEGTEEEQIKLIKDYGGNPLFLKIVSTTIKDLFDGKISSFLAEETIVYGDIGKILDQEFNQISDLEKKVLYWLALNGLSEQIIPGIAPREKLESLELLNRRSLIIKNAKSWTITPIMREYVTQKLYSEVYQDMKNKELAILLSQRIIKPYSL